MHKFLKLLKSVICDPMWKCKPIKFTFFIDEIKDTSKWAKEIFDIIEGRMKMRKGFTKNANTTEIESKMEELKKRSLNLFNDPSTSANYKWLGTIFYIFVFGGLFLLSSFTNFKDKEFDANSVCAKIAHYKFW